MSDSFDDVACTGFTLGSDHGRTFRNPAERLTEVAAAANKRDTEGAFLDVVHSVSRCKDFRLVDVVYSERFKDLSDFVSASESSRRDERDGCLPGIPQNDLSALWP